MKIVHFLDDINLPLSCKQWGDEGTAGIPPIIDDGSPANTVFEWFENPNGNGIYPLIIFINHELVIDRIMGTSPSPTMANLLIQNMLLNVPIIGCVDETACNYNPNATETDDSCIYPAENYNCDGLCGGTVVEDACGICGGGETDVINCLSIFNHFTVTNQFKIQQLYPNPFNPVLNITFDIAWSGFIRVDILDISGNHIKTLHSGFLKFGSHELSWNPENLPSGVYFVSFQAGGNSLTSKVVLLK